MIKITDKNRQQIIYDYAQITLDSMDFQQLWDYAHSGIVGNLENYTNAELQEEIEQTFPEILENKNEVG